MIPDETGKMKQNINNLGGNKMERKLTQRQVESLIRKHMVEYGNFLIKKNRAYGNSAFEAINVYAKGSALDLMKLRMDDKLKKMLKGNDLAEEKEDAAKDFCGYWHLMEILKEKEMEINKEMEILKEIEILMEILKEIEILMETLKEKEIKEASNDI
jgi:hypothetical protein